MRTNKTQNKCMYSYELNSELNNGRDASQSKVDVYIKIRQQLLNKKIKIKHSSYYSIGWSQINLRPGGNLKLKNETFITFSTCTKHQNDS